MNSRKATPHCTPFLDSGIFSGFIKHIIAPSAIKYGLVEEVIPNRLAQRRGLEV
jgi:hypothetical protein